MRIRLLNRKAIAEIKMNSNSSKLISLPSCQAHSYALFSAPLEFLETPEAELPFHPPFDDKSENSPFQILHDSNRFFLLPPASENPAEAEAKDYLDFPFAPFEGTLKKKPTLGNGVTTRGSTERLYDESFDMNVQAQAETTSVNTPKPSANSRLPAKPKKPRSTSRFKAKRQKEISPADREGEEGEEGFACAHCESCFSTSQALGGHMSRAHRGKSRIYRKKKAIRKIRMVERYKLQLAKKKYVESRKYNFEELARTKEGRKLITSLLDRKKLRSIKKSLTKKELDDYIENEVIYSEGFDKK